MTVALFPKTARLRPTPAPEKRACHYFLGILLVATFGAAPAFAQTPRFPVPLNATEGYGACSTARIMNLVGRGAYASVRSGPSRRQRELARLTIGRDVYACVRHGNWFGILYERRPGERRCAWVLEPQRRTTNYRGPCGSGWVHYNLLGGYADFISP